MTLPSRTMILMFLAFIEKVFSAKQFFFFLLPVNGMGAGTAWNKH